MQFWKYQGAGNDFVLVDQRERQWLTREDTHRIARLCDRRFGIGADGLILLQQKTGYDFEMVYFNADGRESTMCGNGGRCIVAFARHLGLIGETCCFWAIDGAHEARLLPERAAAPGAEWVELKMIEVANIQRDGEAYVLNTGSPHYVRFVSGLDQVDMAEAGRLVRYSDRYQQAGINVNFAEANADGLSVRTYERGVEDETLACGTGVTAAAIAWHLHKGARPSAQSVPIQTQGGALAVRFEAHEDGTFSEIWLCGPATRVFVGDV